MSTRTPTQVARDALREAQRRGLVRSFTVRPGGRATIYPADRDGKLYTESAADTLVALRELGFTP